MTSRREFGGETTQLEELQIVHEPNMRPDPPTPVIKTVGPSVGLGPAIAVTAGGLHSCGLELDGRAKCWGKGEDRGHLHRGVVVLVAVDAGRPPFFFDVVWHLWCWKGEK